MDYDFSRLSTRSFEQLIQALACAEFGPSVVVFGDGPDGGREATFTGTTQKNHLSLDWSGYCVFQAKFKQRAQSGANKADTEWAESQLRDELKKYLSGNLKKPEYYVFATNVVLSPKKGSGGKDKIIEILETSELQLKGFMIWDYDQLGTLLDLHISIRQSYLSWITPGDVLANVIESLGLRRKDFYETMQNFIQKELRAEQYASLGQAGSTSQERTPLAEIFVDLPIASNGNLERDEIKLLNLFTDTKEESPKRKTAIKMLTNLAEIRLDGKSNRDNVPSINDIDHASILGRIVFIGGPGQGKSTLTQFFCQLHRVTLIKSSENKKTLPKEIREICSTIEKQCTTENIGMPIVGRFPIRIELNKFASDLANKRTNSLFSYILEKIRTRSEREICPEDLRSWLSDFPWLVALDGLDEVPGTSNREQVLGTIQDFIIDAEQANSDLLFITTTRPQGYNEDFSPTFYSHYQLLQLEPNESARYAERLINQRWSNDKEKIEILKGRLLKASRDESTERLMRSPLQVTIMTLLSETLGDPPRERWRLFNEYHQVITRREKERDIPAAELLNKLQADIDFIHQEVGLKLQIKSENSGGTEALLSKECFSEVVENRLIKEGHTGSNLQDLKNKIIDAAMERLVFLVTPQDRHVGFEIRSLQEFMAAQRLMNASDASIVENLNSIAYASHWRNVFLFAAGRCFYEKQHLRDSLYLLCCSLNESQTNQEDINSIVLTGSHLALDILEDGSVENQPAQAKLYFRLSTRLLELPPSPVHQRLSKLYNDEFQSIFEDTILEKLNNKCTERTLGTWATLSQLKHLELNWVDKIFEDQWPQSKEVAFCILNSISELPQDKWFYSKLEETLPYLSPKFYFKNSKERKIIPRARNKFSGAFLKWLQALDNQSRQNSDTFTIEDVDDCFKKYLNVFNRVIVDFPHGKKTHDGWKWISKVQSINSSSSLEEISHIIKSAEKWSAGDTGFTKMLNNFLPWPIASLIKFSEEGSFINTSNLIEQGDFGNVEDWENAYIRWKANGVTTEDLNYIPEKNQPFDKKIAKVGFPLNLGGASITHTPKAKDALDNLYKLWLSASSAAAKKALATNILFVASVSVNLSNFEIDEISEDIEAIIECSGNDWKNISYLHTIVKPHKWETPKFIEKLSHIGNEWHYITNPEIANKLGAKLELAYLKNSTRGILELLVSCCKKGYIPEHSSLAEKITDKKLKTILKISRGSSTQGETQKTTEETLELIRSREIDFDTIISTIKSSEHKRQNHFFAENLLISLYSHVRLEDKHKLITLLLERSREKLSKLS